MSVAWDELSRTVQLANASARARSQAERISLVAGFEVEGEDGKPEIFHLVVGDGKIALRPGPHLKPYVTARGPADELARVFSGGVSISHPISQGIVRVVQGRYLELVQVEKLIVAARKRSH